MKFFTTDLYLRSNAPDDAVADRADEDWEKAIVDYKKHLAKYAKQMNPRVKELAETLCLHDAELIALEEHARGPLSPPLFLFTFPVETVALRSNGKIINLFYFLWDEVSQSRPPEDWPFSKLYPHWLYDEIDLDRGQSSPPLYWHRILLSDGRMISIPFFDVVIQTFSARACCGGAHEAASLIGCATMRGSTYEFWRGDTLEERMPIPIPG